MPLGPLPFASLVVETAPLRLANWYEYVESFLQDGGGFALVGLWIGLIWPFLRAASEGGRGTRIRLSLPLLVVAVVATGLYIAAFAFSIASDFSAPAVAK